MRVRFHNRAVQFLDKLDEKGRERIRLKLKFLVTTIQEQGIIHSKNSILSGWTVRGGAFCGYVREISESSSALTEKKMSFWYTKSITGEMSISKNDLVEIPAAG